MAHDDSSRIEPKRPRQFFVDGVEVELFQNKKLAIEGPNPNSFPGLLNPNISPWDTTSSFHLAPNQFTERLFDPEITRTINYSNRNVPFVGMGNRNMARKAIENSSGGGFSFGLSISHSLEDPNLGLNYGGIRKVKVSQVKGAENLISGSVGQTYNREDEGNMSVTCAFGKTKDNSASMGLSFNTEENNLPSMGNNFMTKSSNLISMDQLYNDNDNDEKSVGPTCRENGDTILLNDSINKDRCNIACTAQTFKTVDGNPLTVCHSLNMNNSLVSIGVPFSMDESNIEPAGETFNKGAETTACVGHSYNKAEDNTTAMPNSYNKISDNNLSIGYSFCNGESKIISFGGFCDDDLNASERLVCSYDLLMGTSVQKSESPDSKASLELNTDVLKNASQITTSSEIILKGKEEQKLTKKSPPNNFPSNVRSLLSTGILDGVPVKYIAWSQGKELRGTIKGSGYLCSCQLCNHSKAINAYEFERHAGCKTKHPNNHIYFENGKTIYGIVQELRNTSQNLLFEVIQTITGSPINQKSFRLWKESFLAATRELQRIYGKDEARHLA